MTVRESVALHKMRTMVELQLKGVRPTDIATQFGVTTRRVRQIIAKADKLGIVEQVANKVERQMATKLLPKVQKQYEEILDLDAQTLNDNDKGHALKLRAAESLAKGLGVFKDRSKNTMKVTHDIGLDEYLQRRRGRLADEAPHLDAEDPLDGDIVSDVPALLPPEQVAAPVAVEADPLLAADAADTDNPFAL